MALKKEFLMEDYPQIHDYEFKSILQQRADSLIEFLNIPYNILNIILSEYTTLGQGISRIDFAADAQKEDKIISLIIECQSQIPSQEDIKRFFQYVASLRIFKNQDVELYILCTKKVKQNTREFKINDQCTYTMQIISLKNYKATEIFKNIENKLKNNQTITDQDIASLQIIIYTDYQEPPLEILIKARKLIEKINNKNSNMNINEKQAIVYLFDVLCVNMLKDSDIDKYEEETIMLLNPTYRYLIKKGRKEGIDEGRKEGIDEGRKEGIDEGRTEGRDETKLDIVKAMLSKGYPIEEIMDITKLSEEDILNAK